MGGAHISAPSEYFDEHRPRYHVQPPAGWMNDPNGPIHYKGRYHMFYQYLPNACEWDFGIVWGHAISSDLIHWEHLPPALIPTPGWVDADGCFSGCCLIGTDGTPVILYTGVRLRSNDSAGPLPPPEQDLGMVWIESQCMATPRDPLDDLLLEWKKVEAPFLPLPPAHLELTGWRDPFIFATNTDNNSDNNNYTDEIKGVDGYRQDQKEFKILMGSGVKGQGGTALIYKSKSLTQGWELEGQLCEGNSEDTGVVWECPVLVPLLPVPSELRSRHFHAPPRWLFSDPRSTIKPSRIGTTTTTGPAPFSRARAKNDEETKKIYQHGTAATSSAAMNSSLQNAKRSEGGLSSAFASLQQKNQNRDNNNNNTNNNDEENIGLKSLFEFDDISKHQPEPSTSIHHQFSEEERKKNTMGTNNNDNDCSQDDDESIRMWPSQRYQQEPFLPHSRSHTDDHTSTSWSSTSRHSSLQLERAATLEHWHSSSSTSNIHMQTSTVPIRTATTVAGLPSGNETRSITTIAKVIEQQEQGNNAHNDNDNNKDGDDKFRKAHSKVPSLKVHPPFSSWRTSTSTTSTGLGSSSLPDVKINNNNHIDNDDDLITSINNDSNTKKEKQQKGEKEEEVYQTFYDAAYKHQTQYNFEKQQQQQQRQWHLFTVSPDAPTNPVLYWTGFVTDRCATLGSARFEMKAAKGPFRLDLGDIFYAPNVCYDDHGRWLLWGWLQERRKVGTYSYAGCLSLPRILHVNDEGRLIQAPVPEVALLREGRAFHAQHVVLSPDAVVPLQRVSVDRLDIEITFERGSAIAVGILFRSHDAEADGSTAIVYDWDRNQLEAIFNVPPNWHPHASVSGAVSAGVHASMSGDELGAETGINGGGNNDGIPCSSTVMVMGDSSAIDAHHEKDLELMEYGFEEPPLLFDPAVALCGTPRHAMGLSRTTSFATLPSSLSTSYINTLDSPHTLAAITSLHSIKNEDIYGTSSDSKGSLHMHTRSSLSHPMNTHSTAIHTTASSTSINNINTHVGSLPHTSLQRTGSSLSQCINRITNNNTNNAIAGTSIPKVGSFLSKSSMMMQAQHLSVSVPASPFGGSNSSSRGDSMHDRLYFSPPNNDNNNNDINNGDSNPLANAISHSSFPLSSPSMSEEERKGRHASHIYSPLASVSPRHLHSSLEMENEIMPQKENDIDALVHLLEDLAAPMRAPPPAIEKELVVEEFKEEKEEKEQQQNEGISEQQPPQSNEPRRVGGPLLMHPSEKLHLRIIVDHSCIEVYTGSGEVLSTRIYRGRGVVEEESGKGSSSGVDFVAFGGTALIDKIDAYEVGSAWGDDGMTPKAARAMAEKEASYVHASGSYFGGCSSLLSAGGGGSSLNLASMVNTGAGGLSSSLGGGGELLSAEERADELFDEILFGFT